MRRLKLAARRKNGGTLTSVAAPPVTTRYSLISRWPRAAGPSLCGCKINTNVIWQTGSAAVALISRRAADWCDPGAAIDANVEIATLFSKRRPSPRSARLHFPARFIEFIDILLTFRDVCVRTETEQDMKACVIYV